MAEAVIKRISVAVLSVVGVALLLVLIRTIGLSQLAHVASRLERWEFFLIFTFPIATFSIAALRWKTILQTIDSRASFWKLLRLTFLGEAVSLLAPSFTVSGQTVKALLLKRSGIESASALGSVVIDSFVRLFNNLVFTFLVVASVFVFGFVLFEALYILAGIAGGIVMTLFIWDLFRRGGAVSRVLFKVLKPRAGLGGRIQEFDAEIQSFFHRKGAASAALLLSGIGFCWEIAQFALILFWLGVPILLPSVLGIYAGMVIPGVVPVPGGIGFKEAGGAFVGAYMGVGAATALAAVLLMRLRDLSTLLIAAVLFLRERPGV